MSYSIPETNSIGYSTEQVAEALVRFTQVGNIWGGDAGLNGHFWCVRPDGTIWDNEDLNQDSCRECMGIKNNKINYYPCSNAITTIVMLKKIKQVVSAMTGDYETSIALLSDCCNGFGDLTCMFNASVRAYRCGGKVAFGSIGIDSDDGAITCWLSGNAKFSTFADFISLNEERFTVKDQTKADKWAKKMMRMV